MMRGGISFFSLLSSIFALLFECCLVATTVSASSNNTCFTTADELKEAVRLFIDDGCSDTNNCNNTIVQTYGWPIGSWCVSNVTDMSYLFSSGYGSFPKYESFNDDVSKWNVSSVTNMAFMFAGPTAFNQDLSSWDVSSVTNMNGMFILAREFNGDLSSWDVSSVTNMGSMFEQARAFNQDISAWNVSSVTNMRHMFSGAYAAFNQDLSSWDVSSVTDMGFMFSGLRAFNQDLSSWNVSSATNMGSMFSYATAFNQDLSSWDVSSVTNVNNMFELAAAFNQDLCAWGGKLNQSTGTESLFSRSGCVFGDDPVYDEGGPFCASDCKAPAAASPKCFEQRQELKVAVDRYVDLDCTSTARSSNSGECAEKGDLKANYGWPIGNWCVSRVRDMSFLFASKTNFNEDISNWDVSSVTTMKGMFANATSFNQDLSGWDVSSAIDMDGMFDGADSLEMYQVCSWGVPWRTFENPECEHSSGSVGVMALRSSLLSLLVILMAVSMPL